MAYAKNCCPICTGAGGAGGGHLGAGGDRIIHQLSHALCQAGQAHGPAVDRRLAQRMALAHCIRRICGRPRERLILALLQQAPTRRCSSKGKEVAWFIIGASPSAWPWRTAFAASAAARKRLVVALLQVQVQD